VTIPTRSVGDLLRDWRQRRRMSQLELATEAQISTRHLSFVETGRSLPSRDMLLRLAEQLQVPLRDRNTLLNAAGFASVFPEREFADPSLEAVRKAVDKVLAAHLPYPAFAVDRHWTLVASNGGFRPFVSGIDPQLLQPPINVLRLTLHPGGLGPRLANHQQWRSHVLEGLRQQIKVSGDPILIALLVELKEYPAPRGINSNPASSGAEEWHRMVVPFQLATKMGVLSFYTTTTIFGTPVDITLSELSMELFYPADAATAEAFKETSADRTSA